MRCARRPSGSSPIADRSSRHFIKLAGVQSASFGVRVSAVIATRANRSAVRCFGNASANCARMDSELMISFKPCGFFVVISDFMVLCFG